MTVPKLAAEVETECEPTRRLAWPWVTLAISAAACLIFQSSIDPWLIYDRGEIFRGQIWRCWTGHLVHFTPGHLLWDLAVFIPAGCWLESIRPKQARGFYAIVPLFISGILLGFDPALARYAGLSGVATGVLVLLAGLQLERHRSSPAWVWWGILGVALAKVGYEFRTEAPLFMGGITGVRNMPLAHLSGVFCAAFAWGLLRRRNVR